LYHRILPSIVMLSVSLILFAVASAESNSEAHGLLQPISRHHKSDGVDAFNGCKSRDSANQLSLSLQPLDKYGLRSRNISRVVMADFPTMGSSWLRMMMRRISWMVGLQSPIGAVYPEEPFTKQSAFEKVYVDKGWNSSMGSVVFKTHWPADVDLEGPRLPQKIKELHDATMHFDKAIVMLRHPHALVKSNFRRWDKKCYQSLSCIAKGLDCWASWWEHALSGKRELGQVHFVRYEDLCVNPVPEIKRVFDFLGAPYDDISTNQIAQYFEGNYTDWRECVYSPKQLHNQATAFNIGSDHITEHLGQSIMSMFQDTFLTRHYENFQHP